jgi:hypothetical protein
MFVALMMGPPFLNFGLVIDGECLRCLLLGRWDNLAEFEHCPKTAELTGCFGKIERQCVLDRTIEAARFVAVLSRGSLRLISHRG